MSVQFRTTFFKTVILLAAVSLSACATIRTGSHYDETTDFAAYRTFAWIDDIPYITEESSVRVSPLTLQKIQAAIQSELERMGYTYVPNRDEADFIIAYTIGTRDKIRVSSYPIDYPGNWGWHVRGSYFHIREISAHTYSEGTLGVDIFDGASNKPVWHGWAEKTISRADREDPEPVIREGVARLFENFPQ